MGPCEFFFFFAGSYILAKAKYKIKASVTAYTFCVLHIHFAHCDEGEALPRSCSYVDKLQMVTLKVLGFPQHSQDGIRCGEDSGTQGEGGRGGILACSKEQTICVISLFTSACCW